MMWTHANIAPCSCNTWARSTGKGVQVYLFFYAKT